MICKYITIKVINNGPILPSGIYLCDDKHKMAQADKKDLQNLIDKGINEKLPFVFYRLPYKEEIHCIAQSSKENNIAEKLPGFMFSPFIAGDSAPSYFIKADSYLTGKLDEFIGLGLKIKDVSGKQSSVYATKEEFIEQVETAVKEIKSGKLNKVILSRVQKIDVKIGPLEIFIELCKKYKTAFVSLVVIPGKTVWITASPELLVSMEGADMKTVALAGTKSANSNTLWSDKEKEEQKIVADYISSVLDKYCTEIKVSGPTDAIAGNVMHLKTEFSAKRNTSLKVLVDELHPTPAVCGMPKKEAIGFINNTEMHKRKYYTGYLGPYNIDGKAELFVNLRCAEVFNDSVDIYIGGGITSESIAEKEWDETVMKSQTLLSVMLPKAKVV